MNFRTYFQSGGFFQGYAYAYPHKMAYQRLEPALPLKELWAEEDRRALFLYAHIPFCEMRCGFCNLFTTTGADEPLTRRYLDTLERQVEQVHGALGPDAQFARGAIGGGTPTFLAPEELDRLFNILNRFQRAPHMPLAVEMSPGTVTTDRLAVLKQHRVTRASIGVQSFIESETRTLGRPQKIDKVRQALGTLQEAAFPVLNIDLIYGMQGQTTASLEQSLNEALSFTPQEIYLYPLYVRPLTGLHRIGREPMDERMDLLRHAVDFLTSKGWRQVSMRLFRAPGYEPPEGPVYCCQEDGMVGLGAGARSYTTRWHYSSEYGVSQNKVREILDQYLQTPSNQFAAADYGCGLNDEEQQRRHLIKSLLRDDGLLHTEWTERFQRPVIEAFPRLTELMEEGALLDTGARLQPTRRGLELSDVIGPWLFSDAMKARMQEFELA
ncbi:STM4012 family radical SAM protein [Verrucomicrobium sp. BvORR106]|uniref:STM4012 family radical SAM protein n=1 Tax=Verrucomicrobium sp. BvORR106 TaxID=1403819 RepID=UPI0005709AE8|nr:STM4012 family radical SAM protein [Verrucomicrobium sp. BvORR106]